MRIAFILLLLAFGCTTEPTNQEKAEKLIQEEITQNSLGIIQDVELSLTLEGESTYLARYTIPSGVKVVRRYYFNQEFTAIDSIENNVIE